MASYELTYFDGRGLGEVSRLIFAATNTAFKDTRLFVARTRTHTRRARPPHRCSPRLSRCRPVAFNEGAAPTWPEFLAIKASGVLPYNQVPTLVVDGGAPIAQSKAIERYLAQALGVAGSGLVAARLDSIAEAVADIKTK